jgi:hypothetical protein
MEPLVPVQAFRLVVRCTTYGCGSVPDFDRLPLRKDNVELCAGADRPVHPNTAGRG